MKNFFASLLLIAAFSTGAQAATVTTFDSALNFNAATTDQQTTGFSVSCGGACFENQGTSYTTNGITFTSAGGLNINSAAQQNFSVATLSNVNRPELAGNLNILTITLSSAVYAFALDFAESQNSNAISISVGNGANVLATTNPTTVNYTERFLGFTSDTAFNTITLTTTQPDGWFVFDVTTASVPEPSTWAMIIVGFAGLGFVSRRRLNTRSA